MPRNACFVLFISQWFIQKVVFTFFLSLVFLKQFAALKTFFPVEFRFKDRLTTQNRFKFNNHMTE